MNKTTVRLEKKGRFFELFIYYVMRIYARKNINKYKQIVGLSYDVINLKINIEGMYERDELNSVFYFLRTNNHLRPGVALDIGANIGNHSLFMSEFFEEILSFEPNDRIFEILKINSNLRNNITLMNFGLSDSEYSAFAEMDSLNAGSSIVVAESNTCTRRISSPVKLRPLDSVDFIKNKKISLIKIDVEGHEKKVISGSYKTIKKNRPVILFEQSVHEIKSGTSDAIELLKSMGYEFFVLEENFYLGDGRLNKLISRLMKDLFGAKFVIRKTEIFSKKFYSMIIAVHSE